MAFGWVGQRSSDDLCGPHSTLSQATECTRSGLLCNLTVAKLLVKRVRCRGNLRVCACAVSDLWRERWVQRERKLCENGEAHQVRCPGWGATRPVAWYMAGEGN